MEKAIKRQPVTGPAAERAYLLTKELVLTGEFPAGHLFSEGDIAEQLGVSRTPVREAFIRLQSEGLLQLFPKRGVVVTPVPQGEAEDLLDAREAVENAAMNRLVRFPELVPSALERLNNAVHEQRRYAESGDLAAFAQADESFHRAIVEAGNNRLMTDFYATLSDRQRRMSIDALGPTLQQAATVLNEHQELISIIENRDRPAFAPALRSHLNRMYRRSGSAGPHSDDGVPFGSGALG